MRRRWFLLCGLAAPVLFVATTVLGGAIRPGYHHISDTISELFTPGSPNRFILVSLFTLYAVLMLLFGIGILDYVQKYSKSERTGKLGAYAFIAMSLLNLLMMTVFPQDAWGSPATIRGELHIILSGVVSILGILYMLLIGTWLHQTGLSPNFIKYSLATVAAVVIAAVWFMTNYGSPIMGLTERVAAFAGFQWTFVLALWMYVHERNEDGKLSTTSTGFAGSQ